MTLGDFIGYGDEEHTCAVCGKDLRQGEALATMHQDGHKLPICCPLCFEAYEADPKQYLERLAKRTLAQELQRSQPPHHESKDPSLV
jgi:hypothetical protein